MSEEIKKEIEELENYVYNIQEKLRVESSQFIWKMAEQLKDAQNIAEKILNLKLKSEEKK